MNRRHFLRTGLAACLAAELRAAAPGRAPRILLRSSWQVVNIGDIAHTPGVLALLEKHIPEAEVTLWASADLNDEVAAMEHRRFPKLRIVKGRIDEAGKASDAALAKAVAEADFLLHGSGPSLVAAADVAAFARHTGKPFGVFGITFAEGPDSPDTALLKQARFAFFRDSASLEKARAAGLDADKTDFGPDGAFACDLRDEASATAFLKAHGLEEGRFLCCIPRLRYTPYWLIRNRPPTDEQKKRHKRNEAMADRDHEPLREAIARIVRETPHRVLLCPEDMSQMEVGRRWVLEKLPSDVRDRVVWRERFWLTDEALSTYVRSAGVFGLEMHSPIMAVGQGIPALVGRFAEQTTKGLMWRDLGMDDWLFDFDREEDRGRFPAAALALAQGHEAARKIAEKARTRVHQLFGQRLGTVRSHLPTKA